MTVNMTKIDTTEQGILRAAGMSPQVIDRIPEVRTFLATWAPGERFGMQVELANGIWASPHLPPLTRMDD